MPSISVIVPVYQAEKFLRDCVESVRRQTFSDWELLLVDDGCTDGSPALCDELAREDDRIRVFHKERNSGVSETRNVGLDHVRGTYIAFLDSDDQYEPQCLETLWNLRERAGADTAACAHLNLWPDGARRRSRCCPPGSTTPTLSGRKSSIPCWGTGWPSRCSMDSSGAICSPQRFLTDSISAMRAPIWKTSCS